METYRGLSKAPSPLGKFLWWKHSFTEQKKECSSKVDWYILCSNALIPNYIILIKVNPLNALDAIVPAQAGNNGLYHTTGSTACKCAGTFVGAIIQHSRNQLNP